MDNTTAYLVLIDLGCLDLKSKKHKVPVIIASVTVSMTRVNFISH